LKYSCHFLREVTSTTIPQHLLFLDTESYIKYEIDPNTIPKKLSDSDRSEYIKKNATGFKLPWRMGWCCYINNNPKTQHKMEEWKCFRSKNKMIEYIVSKTWKKTCLYVFGHNIFHDLRVLDFFTYAKKAKWDVELFIDSGKTSFLKIRKETKSIAFLSTTNFFPYSLKILGESVGLYKQDVDFETSDYKTIKKYCKQDVNIIKQIILDLLDYIQVNELGSFRITAASQAMFSYRYRFMARKIFPVNDKEIIEFERLSYHGGRTEAFYIGELLKDSVRVYDINSMYPFVMRNNYFPTYCKYSYKKLKLRKLKRIVKYFCVIAMVKIKTNEPVYPTRYNNRLVFPVGTFVTVLTTPEIIYALKHRHIKKVYKTVVYSKDIIFKQYVDFFYAEKKRYKDEGNKPYATLTKLFLNSLYGKFAQRGYDQNVCVNYDTGMEKRERIIDLETGRIAWKIDLINTTIVDGEGKQPTHTFTSISAHVTAYSRIYLWEIIKKAGIKNVYYCDTDSIFTNKKGEKRIRSLIHETKLGMLKLEKKPHGLRIFGLKDYIIDGNATLKGIRKNATIQPDGRYRQQQFESLKTAIRKSHIDMVHVKYTLKRLSRNYTKGIVTRSGRVKPFRFSFLRRFRDFLNRDPH